MVTVTQLLTAEEYFQLPPGNLPTELVRGKIVDMNVPTFRHGKVCYLVAKAIGHFVDTHDLGHVVHNDAGVITERNPDTVRGADVSYYSYQRMPKGSSPKGYPTQPPEIVFEVLSPSNDWSEILIKVGEYLRAGVDVVCIVDPQAGTAQNHTRAGASSVLRGEDELTFPGILEGFSVAVGEFFG